MRIQPRAVTVLLISPFADECEMYEEYLRASGFHTIVCRDVEEALARAPRGVHACVVRVAMDAGTEVVRQLRAHELTRHVPIVAVSTSVQESHRAAMRRAGCDGYLLLPVLPEALAAEIRRVLTHRAGAA